MFSKDEKGTSREMSKHNSFSKFSKCYDITARSLICYMHLKRFEKSSYMWKSTML